MPEEDAYDKLRQGIQNLDPDLVRAGAEAAVKLGVSGEAISALTEEMRNFGEKFTKQECFLADLMLAADAMNSGLKILLSNVPKDKIHTMGKVLIGTVQGDVHDLGKSIVTAMFTASDFEVHDLGVDCPCSRFAEQAMKIRPDIVAASALMSTSMPMTKELIEYLTATGIRHEYKIMVGGAPVTEKYAKEIGADGYGRDANKAVGVARELLASRGQQP